MSNQSCFHTKSLHVSDFPVLDSLLFEEFQNWINNQEIHEENPLTSEKYVWCAHGNWK